MIRQSHDQYAEVLFHLYLDSILVENSRDGDIAPFADERGTGKLVRAAFSGITLSPKRILGSIRMMSDGQYLIQFIVISQVSDKRFQAIKVSSFVQFSSSADVRIAGQNGLYFAEFDNSFVVEIWELEASVVLDMVDEFTFMELEEIWHNESHSRVTHREPIESLPSRFRIKEHEITCALRSRTAGEYEPLWIPQLVFEEEHYAVRESIECVNERMDITTMTRNLRYHAPPPDLEEYRPSLRSDQAPHPHREEELVASFMRAPIARPRAVEEPDFRIDSRNGDSVRMHPNQRLIGSPATIFCGEYAIFKGFLPSVLTIADHMSEKLEEILYRQLLSIKSDQRRH